MSSDRAYTNLARLYDESLARIKALQKKVSISLNKNIKKEEENTRLKEENHRLRDILKGY